MDRFMLCIIISTCIPTLMCAPGVVIDDYAAPRPDTEPSIYTHPYSDSKSDSPFEYDVPSSEYGLPSQKYKLITKNIYIHVPPAEQPEYQPIQTFEKPIPKKHYNIVFIKAPTAPTPTVPVIPEPIQDEHKTLVYVLVKKPEPLPKIELPQIKPTEPSKPEVFFVKYKEDEPSKVYGPPN